MSHPPDRDPGFAVHRVADMQLRGRAGPLRTRVYWPIPSPGDTSGSWPRPLLVHFPDAGPPTGAVDGLEAGDRLCRGLCAQVGVVVLAAIHQLAPPAPGPDAVQDALTVTQWAADHAAELDADPQVLLVGGEGRGGGLAARVAGQARDCGWPPIARQVLIHARTDIGDGTDLLALAGVAPATVVTTGGEGDAYAARLRHAGVEVDELHHGGWASDRIVGPFTGRARTGDDAERLHRTGVEGDELPDDSSGHETAPLLAGRGGPVNADLTGLVADLARALRRRLPVPGRAEG